MQGFLRLGFRSTRKDLCSIWRMRYRGDGKLLTKFLKSEVAFLIDALAVGTIDLILFDSSLIRYDSHSLLARLIFARNLNARRAAIIVEIF